MIRVLIVDDSPSARLNLQHILGADQAFQVVGAVGSGEEAVEAVKRLQPTVVTMDIGMPGIGGIEATRQIMQRTPVPIAIVSNMWNESGTEFAALQAGALAVVEKPPGPGHQDRARTIGVLVQALKQIAGVRVVRRWSLTNSAPGTAPREEPAPARPEALTASRLPASPRELPEVALPRRGNVRLVAIGASTGGPPALSTVLKPLPTTIAVPIVVVQHTALGFLQNLIHWLEGEIKLPVQLASEGEPFLPGHVYFGPEDHHLAVDRRGRAVFSKDPPEHGVRPAVSYLFRSVAENMGPDAIGILLTGMGKDGASELGQMRSRGALTIAQDLTSSVVHGMPGEAIRLKAAGAVLSPEQISQTLIKDLPQGKPRS